MNVIVPTGVEQDVVQTPHRTFRYRAFVTSRIMIRTITTFSFAAVVAASLASLSTTVAHAQIGNIFSDRPRPPANVAPRGEPVQEPDEETPHGSLGHVTACCYSPALGKYIALALVQGGKARHGTRAYVSDPLRKRFGPVAIVSHHFFDPEGSRMHG